MFQRLVTSRMVGESLEKYLHLDWRGFGANIQAAFGSLRRSGELTDVTLACEDGEVVAHRVVPSFLLEFASGEEDPL